MRNTYGYLLMVVLFGLAPLRAQTAPDPFALLPDGTLALARMKGPGEIGRLFEKTNLGRMLAGPEMARHMKPLLETLEKELEEQLARAGHDYAQARQRALGYRGEVVLGLGFLDIAALKKPEPDPEEMGFWMALILSPDGEVDLPALCRAVEEMVEKEAGDRLRDLKVEGRLFRARLDEDRELSFTLPAMVGPHLVVYMGQSLEKAIASSLHGEQPGRKPPVETPEEAGLAVHLDLKAGVDLAAVGFRFLADALIFGGPDFEFPFEELPPEEEPDDAAIGLEQGLDPSEKIQRLLELLGLDTLGWTTLAVAPAKECVRIDVAIDLGRSAERGLFAAFLPAAPGLPGLYELAPLHRTGWGVMFLRLDRLYELARRVAELFAEEIGKRPAELETAFQDFFRVRLKEDLIDHLGGEMITLDLSGEPALPEGDEQEQGLDPLMAEVLGDLPPACYGLSLEDPAAFGRSLETLVRSRGFHVTRKTETYREFDLHRLSIFGFPLHYAVTGRVFLVGPGAGGAVAIRALLDEEADRKAGKQRARMPEEAARRVALCPAGRQTLGVMSVTSQFQVIAKAFQDLPLSGAERPASALLEALLGLLKDYKLEHLVGVNWMKEGRLHSTSIW